MCGLLSAPVGRETIGSPAPTRNEGEKELVARDGGLFIRSTPSFSLTGEDDAFITFSHSEN
jgi:hypothetical protein